MMAARIVVAFAALQLVASGRSQIDPFAFFQPTVAVSADDRRRLDRGEPVARVLSGENHEIAVWAAVRVGIDGNRLVTWMRRVEALKKSAYVLAIGRFSQPPVLDDLAGLSLDDDELSEIGECRRGSCGLKLTGAEIAELQQTAAQSAPDSSAALQRAFRRLILRRVTSYLAEGHGALAPYENHDGQALPAASIARVIGHSTFLAEHMPRFAEHLARYPHQALPDVESFVYWSKERIGGKAIISATHVNVLRGTEPGEPEAIVAGKEIFATHYINASLGVTTIVRAVQSPHRYLVYINRSEVDLVGGMFGGLVRWFVQRRVKSEAATVLLGLKARLESGDPPAASNRSLEFARHRVAK